MQINKKTQSRLVIVGVIGLVIGLATINPYSGQPIMVVLVAACILLLAGGALSLVFQRMLQLVGLRGRIAGRLGVVGAGLIVYFIAMHVMGQLTMLDAILSIPLAALIAAYVAYRQRQPKTLSDKLTAPRL